MIEFSSADDNTNCLAESRPITRESQVGATHHLLFQDALLGICKTSKTNKLYPTKECVTPYHIHVLPLLNRRGLKQLIAKSVCTCELFCALL